MAGLIKKVLQISVMAAVIPALALAAQAPNPRGGNVSSSAARNVEADSNSSIRRSATSVIARTTAVNSRKNHPVVTARSNASRVAVNKKTANASRSARKSDKVVSNKSGVSRSAKKAVSLSRSATGGIAGKKLSSGSVSRAATSRATAVFSDISKIGGGYGSCRDAYATCMDQFCANANDTYRRCYCSDRFTDFRDTADALDTALKMLAEFQDNNLNAVDKTAAEVNAMYSASAGEAAIKKDTSASQQLLDSIGDVLSGKKKKREAPKQTMSSLGVLDLSGFSSGSSGDIWGDNGGGGDSLFGGSSSGGVDMTTLEGKDLYDQSNKQCSEIIREACKGDALFNMAKSAYSIMITQDCNAYQKNIDAKKTTVEETVRTAEKYLREARLEEYRAHNSQDVNDCLNKVEAAMLQPTACGDKYNRCLDYTGRYINPTTGEPIYSKALLKLNELIVLDGSSDVAGANPDFDKFLEEKKIFANQALDGCRDLADTVWSEFKRMAIIQIAQAQDAKIEEVKSSCVSTMKDCYDEQSGALADFDDTSAQATGALTAITTHDMCKDKVLACAALYGDPDGCDYDDSSKKLTQKAGKQCGLTSLLAFVNTVDSVKVAEGCEQGLTTYLQDICKPVEGDTDHQYPWGCRLRALGAEGDLEAGKNNTIYGMLEQRAKNFCGDDLMQLSEDADEMDKKTALKTDIAASANTIRKLVENLKSEMGQLLANECRSIETESNLIWDASGYTVDTDDVINVSPTWLEKAFGNASLQSLINSGVSGYTLQLKGNTVRSEGSDISFGWGVCMFPSARQLCKMQQQLPGMDSTVEFKDGKCVLNPSWFEARCKMMGGYLSGGKCWFE